MFSNINKPSFGSAQPTPTFGFGTTPTQNVFGQSQLFGKSATTTFGSATPAFGQPGPTNQLFQTAQQQQPSSLFQSGSTSTFGSTAATGFGTNLFGNTAAQPGSSGLFGSNTFAQQNKTPAFGFGTSTSQSGNLFGQAQPATQTSSIFQPPVSSSMFGSSLVQPVQGTMIKFVPVTGTDTMQKAGIATTINTKHHCITCMKEYESKSLEELRWEDYQCGRKGPQQQSAFGVTPFGAAAPQSQPIFGQAENKLVFGQTGFGQNTSTFGMQNQQNMNLFPKPTTGFGAPATSTSTFGFNTATNPFAASTAKPFGTSQTQPLFGGSAPQQSSTFGNTLFGSAAQNTSSLFGKPAQQPSAFNTSQTGFTFGQQQPAQSTGLFPQPKPSAGFSLFGNTGGTTGFAQQTGFGQTNQSAFGNNTFGKPNISFGQPTQSTFGSGLGNLQQGSSIFGNTSKPGGLFSNSNTGGGLFSSNTFQPNLGFNVQPQQPQFLVLEQNSDPYALLQIADPFGQNEQLFGLVPKKDKESYRFTDPSEIKALLNTSDKKGGSGISQSGSVRIAKYSDVKQSLFKDIDQEVIDANYKLRSNPRRLVLKKKSNIETPSDIVVNFDEDHDTLGRQTVDLTSRPTPYSPPTVNLFHSQTGESFNISHPNTKSKSTLSVDDANKPNQKITAKAKTQLEPKIPSEQKYVAVLKSIPEVSPLNKDKTSNSLRYGLNDKGTEINPSEISSSTKKVLYKSFGITLNRPDYYMVPPLEELSNHVNSDDKCVIKGLTIGRVGYGNVYFPGEVDITGLNLDEIVHFRDKEIIIYPDDSKKPPIGEGLNTHAQVTLDSVYPHDEDDNILDDPSYLVQIDFAERMKEVSRRHGTHFKEYRVETGSWVFDVDHFSKYGISQGEVDTLIKASSFEAADLDDTSGMSELEEVNGFKMQHISRDRIFDKANDSFKCNGLTLEAGKSKNPTKFLLQKNVRYKADKDDLLIKNCRVTKKDHKLNFLENSELESVKNNLINNYPHYNGRFGFLNSKEEELVVAKHQLNNISLNKMQQDLKNGKEWESNAIDNNSSFVSACTDVKHVYANCNYDDQFRMQNFPFQSDCSSDLFGMEELEGASSRDKDMDVSELSPPYNSYSQRSHMTSNPQDVTLMKATFYDEDSCSDLTESEDYWQQFGEIEKDLSTEDFTIAKRYINIQLKAECFRLLVSDDTLIRGLSSVQDIIKYSSFKVGWSKGLKFTVKNLIFEAKGEELLSEDPFAGSLPDVLHTFLNKCNLMVDLNGIPTYELPQNHILLVECQRLMSQIFLNNPKNRLVKYYKDIFSLCSIFWGPGLHTESLHRRKLGLWLEDVVGCDLLRENANIAGNTAAETIFKLLTEHKIHKAAEVAVHNNLFHLSLLLSQLCSSSVTTDLLQQQYEIWEYNSATKYFENTFLKMYAVLGGKLIPTAQINICQGIDWKRAFALHLWYGTSQSSPVKYALELYEKAFTTLAYAAAPAPIYAKGAIIENTFDIIYLIMRLYCGSPFLLTKIFDPSSHTSDPNDYRLIWLLMQVFTSSKISHMPENSVNYIHTKFAAQLEYLGHWKWAIFVLLFVKEEALKRRLVLDLLARHLINYDRAEVCKIETELIDELKLPVKWVHLALAHVSRVVENYWDEFKHLCLAEKYCEAHRIALLHILPDLVMNRQYDSMKQLLNPYVPGLSQIPQWENGGGLLLDFAELRESVLTYEARNYDETLFNLRSALASLCLRIKKFPREVEAQIACVSEISVQCTHLVRVLAFDDPDGEDYIIKMLRYELYKPPDRLSQDIVNVIHDFISRNDF